MKNKIKSENAEPKLKESGNVSKKKKCSSKTQSDSETGGESPCFAHLDIY